jgi:hypothetical protein
VCEQWESAQNTAWREALRVLPDDDPGWPIKKELLFAFIPGAGIFVRRRLAKTANGLVALRQVFMSFCLALVMFGVVLVFLWPSQSEETPAPGFAIALMLLGLFSSVSGRVVEKPLDCADDVHLAMSYRGRFFLRIAFAQAAALFGFVGFFTTSEWWVYPCGVAIAFVGFARAAPTRANLRRDQEQLNRQACFRSLVAALTTLPPSPRGG